MGGPLVMGLATIGSSVLVPEMACFVGDLGGEIKSTVATIALETAGGFESSAWSAPDVELSCSGGSLVMGLATTCTSELVQRWLILQEISNRR